MQWEILDHHADRSFELLVPNHHLYVILDEPDVYQLRYLQPNSYVERNERVVEQIEGAEDLECLHLLVGWASEEVRILIIVVTDKAVTSIGEQAGESEHEGDVPAEENVDCFI